MAIIKKFLPAVLVVTVVSVVASYANQRFDPYAEYKKFDKKPLALEKKKLKHYQHELNLIHEKLKLHLSQRERSILAGLHFIISFADDEQNFEYLFADLLLLSSALKHAEDRIHQKEIVTSFIATTFKRGAKNLERLFGTEENQRWKFISLLGQLTYFPQWQEIYHAFYRSHFPPVDKTTSPKADQTLDYALAVNDYKRIFDHILEHSFLHHFNRMATNHDLLLPEDKFQSYLKKLEAYTYIQDHPQGSSQLRSLGYLATHVILVINNYGEFPASDSLAWKKAQEYIEGSFEKISKMGDFDLYAEYIQCLKFFYPGENSSRIKRLEKFIYDLQRPDGSWGSERDFKTNPYTAIHPTGAALMALNSGNLPRQIHR